jgi:hypothetical protein
MGISHGKRNLHGKRQAAHRKLLTLPGIAKRPMPVSRFDTRIPCKEGMLQPKLIRCCVHGCLLADP